MHACIIIIALLRIMIVPSLPSHCKRDPLLRNLLTAAALHPRLRLVSASMLQVCPVQCLTRFSATQLPVDPLPAVVIASYTIRDA